MFVVEVRYFELLGEMLLHFSRDARSKVLAGRCREKKITLEIQFACAIARVAVRHEEEL